MPIDQNRLASILGSEIVGKVTVDQVNPQATLDSVQGITSHAKKVGKIEARLEKLNQLHREVEALLKDTYPEGSTVFVKLSSSQKNPSEAVVVGHGSYRYPWASVRVRLKKANWQGRHFVTDASLSDVVDGPYETEE